MLVVCLGVGLATITDPQISSNLAGLAAGFGSVAATALYQIWAGSKQKELGLGSMQLLHQYVPLATGLLALLVPLCEPMGWRQPGPDTLLGYRFTTGSVVAIAISSVLGLLVNLSTFLVSEPPLAALRALAPGTEPTGWLAGWRPSPPSGAVCGHAHPCPPWAVPWLTPAPAYHLQVIGATSSLTYNVVGHIKTVLILSGGVAFFGDTMPPKKAAGILAAMGGIVW